MAEQISLFGSEFGPVVKNTAQQETVEIFSKEDKMEAAFTMFRELGFPYPSLTLPEMMSQLNELANLPLDKCLRSNLGYRIADTYNRHRFHASAIKCVSPYDGFMDDKKLKKSIRKHFDQSDHVSYTFLGFMSLVDGVQACSNFRPAYARLMYNTYAPKNGVVLDTSTGYGGRLVGFLASHCSEYYGVDPNTVTYAANMRMVNDLGKHKSKIHLFNYPVEDAPLGKIKGRADIMFTSPPYYSKEIYSDEATQSCNRYKSYDLWALGFLYNMLRKTYETLKVGGHCIVNIHDISIDKVLYPLIDDTIYLGKQVGLKHLRNDVFIMNARVSSKNGVKTVTEPAKEIVIIFQKLV